MKWMKTDVDMTELYRSFCFNFCPTYLFCFTFNVNQNSGESLFYYLSYTFEPGYNDIGLYDTSSIASHILWYQLISHC
jgi:hypothetical protein